VLQVAHLRKEFATVVAVDDVSLDVQRGEILGLLGPNGAGKTTTIRTVLNIIQPDAGTITFDGKPFDESIRNSIGYLPEERGLYRKSKLLNTILYFASLKGIDFSEGKRRAYEWLKRFDLLNYYERKVEELSKGNQQKVQFIIAILHDPELMILDEPFSGLDPINQIILKDILLELKQRGKAIIFSTHQMDQAEKLCDRICLINKGKVVLDGGVNEVKSRYGKNTVRIEYDGDGTFLSSVPSVKSAHVYENFAELILTSDCRPPDLLRDLASKLEIRKFETAEPSLNSIFLDVVGTPIAPKPPEPIPLPTKLKLRDPSADRRVKRALNRVLFGAALLIVAVVVMFLRNSFSWETPGLFLLITVVSFYKYQRTVNTVRAEMHQKAREANSNE
jgi:ABC-2 type transport system ATP-binding protein